MQKSNKGAIRKGTDRSTKAVLHHQRYQGPIPPPEVLAKFDEIEPGIANRIIGMAEKDAEHVRKVREKSLDNDAKKVEREARIVRKGQNFSFILTVVFLILSFVLIFAGIKITGSIFASIAVVVIALSLLQPFKNKK